MPRVTVDNEVHKRITSTFPESCFNNSLRRYCGLPVTNGRKCSRPKKKQNRFMKLVKNIFKGRLI